MKYWIFPASLLLALFFLSLFNSCTVQKNTDSWIGNLEYAQQSSTEENWHEVTHSLERAYSQWCSQQMYLRIVCNHANLNTAESLFRRCLILSHDGDVPEFHSNLAELISQLRLLGETESFHIKNIL